MHIAVEAQMRAVDWLGLLTASGTDRALESNVRRLLEATTEHDANEAYWCLDNEIVVQGRLYPGSIALVPIFGTALALEVLSPPAKLMVLDLLVELAFADPTSESEELTAIQVEARLKRYAPIIETYLWDDNAPVRRAALDILRVLPEEELNLVPYLEMLCHDEDELIRRLAESLMAG
jgi:hypothetical protein